MRKPRSHDMRNLVRGSLKRDFGPPIKHYYRMGTPQKTEGHKFFAEGDLSIIVK
jgi:hypothetical protein